MIKESWFLELQQQGPGVLFTLKDMRMGETVISSLRYQKKKKIKFVSPLVIMIGVLSWHTTPPPKI